MCRLRATSRQKVALGYYVVGALTFTLSILILLELKFIEKKIMAYDAVNEFFVTTLEIRRSEKNFFLYGQRADYEEATTHVAAAQKSLEENFALVADPRQAKALLQSMSQYKELLRQYADIKEDDRRTFLEGGIRKLGRDITTMAQGIAKSERKSVQAMIKNTRTFLIVSIIALAVLGAGIFQILSKTVVHPPGDREGD